MLICYYLGLMLNESLYFLFSLYLNLKPLEQHSKAPYNFLRMFCLAKLIEKGLVGGTDKKAALIYKLISDNKPTQLNDALIKLYAKRKLGEDPLVPKKQKQFKRTSYNQYLGLESALLLSLVPSVVQTADP